MEDKDLTQWNTIDYKYPDWRNHFYYYYYYYYYIIINIISIIDHRSVAKICTIFFCAQTRKKYSHNKKFLAICLLLPQLYNFLWVLACSIIPLNGFLSCAFCFQLFIPIFLKSSLTSSSHLNLGLPFGLVTCGSCNMSPTEIACTITEPTHQECFLLLKFPT